MVGGRELNKVESQLANKYDIAGVASWRKGFENLRSECYKFSTSTL